MSAKRQTYPRENHVTDTVDVTATRVSDRTPHRVLFIASNTGANAGFLGVNNLISARRGIRVAVGEFVILTRRDHYDLVTDELWAVNEVGADTWWFLEQLELPEGFGE